MSARRLSANSIFIRSMNMATIRKMSMSYLRKSVNVKQMLDNMPRAPTMPHEPAAPRNPYQDTLDAGRGIVHAVDFPRVRRVDKYRIQAARGCRDGLCSLP